MTENQDHVKVMVSPPLIFLGYLVGGLILHWANPFSLPQGWALRAVAAVALVGGVLLALTALAQIKKAHTTPDLSQPSTALVRTGPYRFTRNPIYLGFLLIYLGFTLLAGTLWGILLSPFLIWTVTHTVIHAEEAYLESKFGDEYRAYAARVRQWL